jgi:hypothetical protein
LLGSWSSPPSTSLDLDLKVREGGSVQGQGRDGKRRGKGGGTRYPEELRISIRRTFSSVSVSSGEAPQSGTPSRFFNGEFHAFPKGKKELCSSVLSQQPILINNFIKQNLSSKPSFF